MRLYHGLELSGLSNQAVALRYSVLLSINGTGKPADFFDESFALSHVRCYLVVPLHQRLLMLLYRDLELSGLSNQVVALRLRLHKIKNFKVAVILITCSTISYRSAIKYF